MPRPRDPATIDPRFGRRIRQLRLARNMTCANLACSVRVSRPMISYWEKGQCRPNAVMVQRIALALGVGPSDLYNYASLQPDDSPVAAEAAR